MKDYRSLPTVTVTVSDVIVLFVAALEREQYDRAAEWAEVALRTNDGSDE